VNFELLPVVVREESLGILEFESLPFVPVRVYWLHNLNFGAIRGFHAHKTLRQFMWAISGTVIIKLQDGKESVNVQIESNATGLLLEPGLWRELHSFSQDAVILVAASQAFDESDYIRNWDQYLKWTADAR
jgi:dTDP-4-dehydrorhamnose 3,5-epimerase-like enzyme